VGKITSKGIELKVVLVTGGFDPIHSGHILLCNSAKTYGDYLIVGLNSDDWLVRKKGQAFMPWDERRAVVSNLKAVDEVMSFDDSDGTACDLLEKVKKNYPGCQIIFANGGDRTAVNIPEMSVKDVIFQFGVGGDDKKNSSSWILNEWKAPRTQRSWGYYRVLHDVPGTKVKELTIDPGQSLSMQRHFKRHEFWHVTEGECYVESQLPSGYTLPTQRLTQYSQVVIPIGDWHKLTNPFEIPCRIVEIQYGDSCDELDIERK
jgi:cytidyltransferase-like protein